jgi:hypothetical protein
LPKEEALNSRARRRHSPPDAALVHADAVRAARQALHSFVAGFGVAPGACCEALTERLLVGARRHHRDHPQIDLADCATWYAEQQFEAWLGVVLAPELAPDQPALAAGRAAFLSCGGPAAWPELILVHDPLPDGFVSAMRAAMPALAPLPAPGSMPAQTLESWSIAEVASIALVLLTTSFAWTASARPLVTASIKLAKSWS